MNDLKELTLRTFIVLMILGILIFQAFVLMIVGLTNP